jgi:hypothetical protein
MPDTLTSDQIKWTVGFTGLNVAQLQAVSASPDGGGPDGGSPDDGAPGGGPGDQPQPPADPAAVAEGAKVDKARADIGKKFGVKSVADGDAPWKSSETTTVNDAFDAIPGADKAVLKGIQVERVHSIDATHAAQYSTETSADESTPATQTVKIQVGDSTFDSNGTPVPAGEQKRVIVHEVGHAVAGKKKRAADMADAQAQEAVNMAADAYNKINDPSNDAINAENDLVQPMNDAADAYNAAIKKHPVDPAEVHDLKAKYNTAKQAFDAAKAKADAFKPALAKGKAASDAAKAHKKQTAADQAATRVSKATVDKGQKEVDGATGAADAARTAATGAAGGMNAQDQTDSKDYRDAVDDVAAKLKAYADDVKAGNVTAENAQTEEAALNSAIDARDDARKKLTAIAPKNPALTTYADTEKTQKDWADKAKTQARLADRAPKIQEFVDIVNKNHITPDTPYAQDNWPFAPEEFFAEAYSIWRTDPDKLKKDAKELFKWFEGGKYR